MKLVLVSILLACLIADQVSADAVLERKLYSSLFLYPSYAYQTPKDVLNKLNVLNFLYTSGEPNKASNAEKQLVFDLIKLPLLETCNEKNRDTFEELLRLQRDNANIFNYIKDERARFLKNCY